MLTETAMLEIRFNIMMNKITQYNI